MSKNEAILQFAQTMEQRGLSKIVVHYVGEEDNGGIDEFEYWSEKGMVELPKSEANQFGNLLWDLLSEHLHPGFEINGSGFGTLILEIFQQEKDSIISVHKRVESEDPVSVVKEEKFTLIR